MGQEDAAGFISPEGEKELDRQTKEVGWRLLMGLWPRTPNHLVITSADSWWKSEQAIYTALVSLKLAEFFQVIRNTLHPLFHVLSGREGAEHAYNHTQIYLPTATCQKKTCEIRQYSTLDNCKKRNVCALWTSQMLWISWQRPLENNGKYVLKCLRSYLENSLLLSSVLKWHLLLS